MSDTLLKEFQSAVNEFDSLVRSLPDIAGAKEIQDKVQKMPGKLVGAINLHIFAK